MKTKIAVSIVTYKNEEHINRNIDTLLASDIVNHDYKIEIINNNSNFRLYNQHHQYVTVIHNSVRPDWSTGHISRDYNSAYLRNFVKLSSPSVDWVVTSQDDVIWKPNWVEQLLEINASSGYNFISSGVGDAIVAVTAEAIRHTGLWDERICAIAWHEGDMFARAVMWNKEKSSINDAAHNRLWNPCDHGIIGGEHESYRYNSRFIIHPNRNSDQHSAIKDRYHTGDMMIPLIQNKWGDTNLLHQWTNNRFIIENTPERPVGNSYIFYPYFEMDVYNLKEKGYIV